MRRLTASTLKPARLAKLAAQHGVSPITGKPVTDPVYDHDHKTGMMRAVLNRWENAVLGRIENWAGRLSSGVDPVAFLRGVADYLEFHSRYPSQVLHPSFRTDDEKRELRNKRARIARKLNKEKANG